MRFDPPTTSASLLLLSGALVAALLGEGCKKKSTDDSTGPTATGQAAVDAYEKKAIAAIDEKLKSVEALKGKLPATTTDGVVLDAKASSTKWWVHDIDLANVETTPTGRRVKDANEIRECAKEVRHPDFGKHSVSKLGTCERTRYALVVRTLARTEPKVTQEAKGMEGGKFLGGNANGDVVVYDVEAKKVAGAFRWTAGSTPLVLDGKIAKDFDENVFVAIQQAYVKYVK